MYMSQLFRTFALYTFKHYIMSHTSIITTSRYHGARVLEYARTWGCFYKVEVAGVVSSQVFYFLADAFNAIDAMLNQTKN